MDTPAIIYAYLVFSWLLTLVSFLSRIYTPNVPVPAELSRSGSSTVSRSQSAAIQTSSSSISFGSAGPPSPMVLARSLLRPAQIVPASPVVAPRQAPQSVQVEHRRVSPTPLVRPPPVVGAQNTFAGGSRELSRQASEPVLRSAPRVAVEFMTLMPQMPSSHKRQVVPTPVQVVRVDTFAVPIGSGVTAGAIQALQSKAASLSLTAPAASPLVRGQGDALSADRCVSPLQGRPLSPMATRPPSRPPRVTIEYRPASPDKRTLSSTASSISSVGSNPSFTVPRALVKQLAQQVRETKSAETQTQTTHEMVMLLAQQVAVELHKELQRPEDALDLAQSPDHRSLLGCPSPLSSPTPTRSTMVSSSTIQVCPKALPLSTWAHSNGLSAPSIRCSLPVQALQAPLLTRTSSTKSLTATQPAYFHTPTRQIQYAPSQHQTVVATPEKPRVMESLSSGAATAVAVPKVATSVLGTSPLMSPPAQWRQPILVSPDRRAFLPMQESMPVQKGPFTGAVPVTAQWWEAMAQGRAR